MIVGIGISLNVYPLVLGKIKKVKDVIAVEFLNAFIASLSYQINELYDNYT